MSTISPALVVDPARSTNPYQEFLARSRAVVRAFYDRQEFDPVARDRASGYYRRQITRLMRHLVPPGARVLDVGCGTGDLLAALEPAEGTGVDCSSRMVAIARGRHPELRFATGFAEDLHESDVAGENYDFVTMVNVVGEMSDVQRAFQQAHACSLPNTRLIVVQYNYLWEPVCRLATRMGLKLDRPTPNWFAPQVISDLMHLSGFELIRQGRLLPLPVHVPGLSWLTNRVLAHLPVLSSLGFLSYYIARPIVSREAPERSTCSVVVPCKNEEDNIAGLVERIPEMGAGTQIIFVDDKSTDATAQRVRREMAERPDREILLVPGPGEGKGAACRAGFAAATGDVFMILDADMTVMPEELPAFFEAITSGRGEFINGSRMVYPLEDQAMRGLNILGNKMFAGLFTLLLGQRIRDTLCGTKVVWKQDYRKILAARDKLGSCDVWGDYDWIFGAALHNLKIIELPVHYRERVAGTTKMTRRIRNAWVMLRMCWLAARKLCLVP